MKTLFLLPFLSLLTSPALSQQLPPHRQMFGDKAILEPKSAPTQADDGRLVINGGALEAVHQANLRKYGYGYFEVWRAMSRRVKIEDKLRSFAPSDWSAVLARETVKLRTDPDNALSFATRAASWNNAILVANGVALQNGVTHLDTTTWTDVVETPNQDQVDANLAEVWKRPLTLQTLSPVIVALRVSDYTPLASGQFSPPVQKLDDAISRYAKTEPRINEQHGVILGKVALFALGAKMPVAGQCVERFTAPTKVMLQKSDGAGLLAFMLLTVESASGTLQGDFAAQVAAAEAKNPLMAADVEAQAALTLWDAHLPDDARKWAALSIKRGGADPLPIVQYVAALSEKDGSDGQFELLKKCAFAFSFNDRNKLKALALLSAQAATRGDKKLELLAIEEQIMAGGPATLWRTYSQKACAAEQYGNAWNANRLALRWQSGSDGKAHINLNYIANSPDPDQFPPTYFNINQKSLTRLEGAYLLVKLGQNEAARGEYDALTGDTASLSDWTAFLTHRHFLREQLAKTPADTELKYGFERLNSALAQFKNP